MRIGFGLAVATGLWVALAQERPSGHEGLTAEEILEKSIEAAGGREAYAKLTSTAAKGLMEFTSQELHGTIEFYAKAPNKRLLVTNIENIGETRQGFDGEVAWVENLAQGVRKLEGAELERVRQEAEFHRPLKWRELYRRIELKGKQLVAGRPVWVLRLTPKAGKPLTHYYDAESFLLVGQELVEATPQGQVPLRAWMFDYRDVGGVKTPYRIEQETPWGKIVIKFTEIQNNVEIDDARFRMPRGSNP